MADEARARKVLIVEDSATMRQLLGVAARRQSAEVYEAENGLGAVKLLAQQRFDCVFLDINMPVMDGYKLIRHIREDRADAGLPICVCTTDGSPETEAHARSLGADYFLRKPIQRRDVEAVIVDAFRRRP